LNTKFVETGLRLKSRQKQSIDMKVKLLGITVFEIQQDPITPLSRDCSPLTPAARPAPEQPSVPLQRHLASALRQPSHVLPRTDKGTIDVARSLQMLDVRDPDALWRQKFERGTAGAALKCILGAQRQRQREDTPTPSAPDLRTYPADELPLEPGTGRLDLGACLLLFGIKDPAALWQQRFAPKSAGGRIKMRLRADGFDPGLARKGTTNDIPPDVAKCPPPEQEEIPQFAIANASLTTCIIQDVQGNIDIEASLRALGIDDPKKLWQKPVKPCSEQHILKKEIARRLSRHGIVHGITQADVGLTTSQEV
jgi:hypothetical protein